jgi:hypothetical protein
MAASWRVARVGVVARGASRVRAARARAVLRSLNVRKGTGVPMNTHASTLVVVVVVVVDTRRRLSSAARGGSEPEEKACVDEIVRDFHWM